MRRNCRVNWLYHPCEVLKINPVEWHTRATRVPTDEREEPLAAASSPVDVRMAAYGGSMTRAGICKLASDGEGAVVRVGRHRSVPLNNQTVVAY